MDKYVYVLLENNIPFYIGKGTRALNYKNPYQRPEDHIKEASFPKEKQSNRLKCAFINKILNRGDLIDIEILKDNLTDSQAIKLETQLIKEHKRLHEGGTLTNLVVESVSHDIRRVPVYCFSLDGKLIKHFESIKQAANETQASMGAIVNCCKRKYKSSKGYVWSYTDAFPGYRPNVVWNKQQVDCYSVSGQFIKTYSSALDAEKHTNIQAGSINKCRRGLAHTAGGLVWVVHGKQFKTPNPKLPGKPKRTVQQFSLDGELLHTYPSLTDAINKTKLTGICRCCLGQSKSCGGYLWKYVE